MKRTLWLLPLLACAAQAAPPPKSAPPVFNLHAGLEYFDTTNAATGPSESTLAAQAEERIDRQDDRGALAAIDRYLAAFPNGPAAEELLFWKGFCAYRSQRPQAEADLNDFLKSYPQSPRVFEARRTLGLLWERQKKFPEAARLFATLETEAGDDAHHAGEARLFGFLCRVEGGDLDGALDLFKKSHAADPSLAACDQIAAFELCAFRLGAALLDQGKPEEAVDVLRTLRPREAVAAALAVRDEVLARELLSHPERAAEIGALRAAAKSDLAALAAVPDYDAALQLRTAAAFSRVGQDQETVRILAAALPAWPAATKPAAAAQLAASQAALGQWREVLAALDAAGELPPGLVFLRAEAQQNLGNLSGAIATLQTLRSSFPEQDRAAFLLGYIEYQAGKNAEAEAQLGAFEHDFPKSPYRESAGYWRGMALFAQGKYPEARQAWTRTRTAFPHGTYPAECEYQEAHALCAARDFSGGAAVLEKFRAAFPNGPEQVESIVLLADCRLGLGKFQEGIALLEQVPSASPLHGYAALRIGAAREALGDDEAARAGYLAFLRDFPGDPSAPQLLARLGRLDRRDGKEEEALAFYVDALDRYGDAAGSDVLFGDLAALGDTPVRRAEALGHLNGWAADTAHSRRAARACWAASRLAADPAQARAFLLRGAALNADIAPAFRADFADALREDGKTAEAEAVYRSLLATNETARAHAGLGLLEAQTGKAEAARAEFAEAEKGGPPSATLAPAWQVWAELDEKAGRSEAALADWERLLRLPGLSAVTAVGALNHLGDLYLQRGAFEKAIPCYQRIYVMYGRWPDYVARAYWQSAQAFEKLDRKQEAVNTYRELAHRSDLASFAEAELARQRLRELGAAGS